jgi:hypothetical protein
MVRPVTDLSSLDPISLGIFHEESQDSAARTAYVCMDGFGFGEDGRSSICQAYAEANLTCLGQTYSSGDIAIATVRA